MELYILISIFILFFLYNLTDAEFIKLLRYRFDNDFLNNDDICDIFSGQEYRKLMQPGSFLSKDNPLNISFSFNTDGVAPSGLQVVSFKNIGLNIGAFLQKYRDNIGIFKKYFQHI